MKQIQLTKGMVALVDDADFDWLNQYKWMASKPSNNNNYYATRTIRSNGKQREIKMHREILGLTNPNELGDHADCNGLNNQRSNLRKCTHKENARNKRKCKNKTSEFKGVSLYKRYNKWMVQIRIDNKVKCLGYFESEIIAARIYDEKAREVYGEFANVNFR